MKKDVIQRNLERLIYSDYEGEKEPIEPMSAWKWNELYRITTQQGIGAWVSDGIRRNNGDFFLNIPPDLRQKFLTLPNGKVPERLARFQLEADRRLGFLQRYSSQSLRAYWEDFLKTVKNIEE